jgi:class 3 adenylate cyclase
MGAPSGTVTFLFTDIEGSTRVWQRDEAAMREAVRRHDELLRTAILEFGGVVFSTMGDGFAAAFTTAGSQSRTFEVLVCRTSGTARLVVRLGGRRGASDSRTNPQAIVKVAGADLRCASRSTALSVQ